MNASLIQDTFKYFAKYPVLNGVLKNFQRTAADPADAYDTFKATIAALTPNSLISGLQDYIFGADILAIQKRIENTTGIYLYIDYGNISDTLMEPMKTEIGTFTIGVTIAKKSQPDDLDPVQQLLIADATMAMLSQLKDIAKADAHTNKFLKNLTFPLDITPWFAPDFFNSIGWTMTFQTRGVHLI